MRGAAESMFQLSFFFQAEDGIRDTSVTGVQTCALPISGVRCGAGSRRSPNRPQPGPHWFHSGAQGVFGNARAVFSAPARTEERRVGKSVGLGWWRRVWKEERGAEKGWLV